MSPTIESVTARPPGRPRSARAEKAIVDATIHILAEDGGVAAVSIEAVAARAGVGKTTIYRRWPNKEALIVDSLSTIKHPLPELEGRSVREDLLALARALGVAHERRTDRCFWNVLGTPEKHPELYALYKERVVEPRREVIREVLRRGAETGELRPDIDAEVAIQLLVGGMTLQQRSCATADIPADFPERLVDMLLSGIQA